MTSVWAVDPGKHKCGIAYAVDGVLHDVDTISVPALLARARPHNWVCEKPLKYGHLSVTHADLDSLALTLTRLTTAWGPPKRQFFPRAWKGQVPKAAHHNRVRGVLSESERELFDAADHNGRDAACLVLFYAGRVGVGGARVTG